MGHKMFPYILIRGGQARPCWTRHYFPFSPSASYVVGLEVKLSALKRTRRPYNIVVFFSECMVWLTGSLGPICCFFGFYWFFGSSLHCSEEVHVVLIR